MTTDTSERGLERLICTALTGSPCEPNDTLAEESLERPAAYNIGWVSGDPDDYDRKPEPELDRLSNIVKVFNERFGNVPWEDVDRVHRLITEEIPARVEADTSYRNAQKYSDRQNARIEHDKALSRVMTAIVNDDTQLFKHFADDASFKQWLTDAVFTLTYRRTESRPEQRA